MKRRLRPQELPHAERCWIPEADEEAEAAAEADEEVSEHVLKAVTSNHQLEVFDAMRAQGYVSALDRGQMSIEEFAARFEQIDAMLIRPAAGTLGPGGLVYPAAHGKPLVEQWNATKVRDAVASTAGAPVFAKAVQAHILANNKMWAQMFAGFHLDAPGIGVAAPDPPALPEEETDQPYLGYRTWTVVTQQRQEHVRSPGVVMRAVEKVLPGLPDTRTVTSYRLQSVTTDTVWDGPIMRADGVPCGYDPHEQAWWGRDDHCYGIYAHDQPEWRDLWHQSSDTAIGKVELSGTIVVHERGYRAEHCRILNLVLSPVILSRHDRKALVADLEDTYRCDVSFDMQEIVG